MRKVILTLLLGLSCIDGFAQLWYRGRYKEYEAGMTGIYLVQPVTFSPDGKNCYIGSYNGLTWYDVDVVNANLTYRETLTDGSLAGGDGISDGHAITVSPDGRFVYLAAGYLENSISIFTRNTTTGAITFQSILRDGDAGISNLKYPYGLVMDRGGKNLYAACKDWDGNSLLWFSVNATTGALTYMGKFVDGVGGVDGLQNADNVTISPDGKNVYVVAYGDDALTWYTRDTTSGNLSYGGMLKDNTGGVDGLDSPLWVTVSPDGKFIYAGAESDNSIAWFSRDASTGAPTYVNRIVDGDKLSGTRGIAMHPSGNWLVASATNTDVVSWYSVNTTTGALSFAGYVKNGKNGVDGIDGTRYNGFSPDGSFFVATGYDGNGVAWFHWGDHNVGIDGLSIPDNIVPVPNPAQNIIHFTGFLGNLDYSLTVTDMLGRTVIQTKLTSDIDCSILPNGVYMYTVSNQNTGTKQLGKISIQR